MNQDPQNLANPAAAATPSLDPTPVPAPGVPLEAPTLDPSLLQQAINDVPDEAAETTPAVPSAVNLNNLDASVPPAAPSMDMSGVAGMPMPGPQMPNASMGAPMPDPMASVAPSPFATAAPAADFSAPAPTQEMPMDPSAGIAPAPGFSEAPKTTPSVAFNDPAQAPDAPTHGLKKPAFLDGKKINPVILIVAGGAFIIIALVLLLAFAV